MRRLILILLLSLSTVTAQAAVNMFLEIEGVKGESQDTEHSEKIDILAWSWGTSTDGRRVCIQDLSLTKYTDVASPPLLMSQVSNTHFPTAVLTVSAVGARGELINTVVLELTDVYVSSISTGGSWGEDRLTENVTLNFDQLKYSYTPSDNPKQKVSATISSEKCK
ncbi:type VI secretion system tube protein Hcp [Shewanella acanthi]|nr:type VI secretion system tube protein Hcp [Shewanella acanthi]